jgi:hypothetical protein
MQPPSKPDTTRILPLAVLPLALQHAVLAYVYDAAICLLLNVTVPERALPVELRHQGALHPWPCAVASLRICLVRWLQQLATVLELHGCILHRSIDTMDRYIHVVPVPREQLQLLAGTALLLACQYEADGADMELSPGDVAALTKYAVTGADLVRLQAAVLGKLGGLSASTVWAWTHEAAGWRQRPLSVAEYERLDRSLLQPRTCTQVAAAKMILTPAGKPPRHP